MLNILPPSIIVVALSAELAWVEGKTICGPWMHHPVWNNDHWTVPLIFQRFFKDLLPKSLPCVTATSKQSTAWNLQLAKCPLVDVNEARFAGVGVWGGVYVWLVFRQMLLETICFTWAQRLLRAQQECLGITEIVAIHLSDDLKAVSHSLEVADNCLLSKHDQHTQGPSAHMHRVLAYGTFRKALWWGPYFKRRFETKTKVMLV